MGFILTFNQGKRKKSLGPSSDSDLSSGSDTSDVKIIEVKLPEKSLGEIFQIIY